MSLQVWSLVPPSIAAGRTAQRLEESGWDGIMFPDSQSVTADVIVAMTAAATATSTLGISTGVTNPVTRHPVALAGALLSLQELSGGRAALGIGRGDSALAHLALAPAPTALLEKSVRVMRTLVRGGKVPFADLEDFRLPGLKHVDAIALAHDIEATELRWRNPSFPPPPIDVSASGPRTIACGAKDADGVLLAVGAAPDRLRWAVELARDNGATRIGAYINIAVHPDLEVATRLARALVAPFARFSVLDGVVRAPIDDKAKQELTALHSRYDMNGHGRGIANHADELDTDFVRSFGIAGPPDECVRRIREITEIGVDRVVIVGPIAVEGREEVALSRTLFNTEVLPQIKSL